MKNTFPNNRTEFNGALTISRPSSHDNVDRIVFKVRDEASRLTVLECEIDPGDFMIAITGLAERPTKGWVSASGVIGKKRIDEKASVVVPYDIGSDRDKAEKYLLEKCQPRDGTSIPTSDHSPRVSIITKTRRTR